MITKEADADANVIWGTAFDDSLTEEMRITVIATGFDGSIKSVPIGDNGLVKDSALVMSDEEANELDDDIDIWDVFKKK